MILPGYYYFYDGFHYGCTRLENSRAKGMKAGKPFCFAYIGSGLISQVLKKKYNIFLHKQQFIFIKTQLMK